MRQIIRFIKVSILHELTDLKSINLFLFGVIIFVFFSPDRNAEYSFYLNSLLGGIDVAEEYFGIPLDATMRWLFLFSLYVFSFGYTTGRELSAFSIYVRTRMVKQQFWIIAEILLFYFKTILLSMLVLFFTFFAHLTKGGVLFSFSQYNADLILLLTIYYFRVAVSLFVFRILLDNVSGSVILLFLIEGGSFICGLLIPKARKYMPGLWGMYNQSDFISSNGFSFHFIVLFQVFTVLVLGVLGYLHIKRNGLAVNT